MKNKFTDWNVVLVPIELANLSIKDQIVTVGN